VQPVNDYRLRPIGYVRSELRSIQHAPRQGQEGAPDAWLELASEFIDGLSGLDPGDDLFIITWLHQADRQALQVHPRNVSTNPLQGVFSTRSQDRPNPIGLHSVTLRTLCGLRLLVGPLEAIDGTPILDIKPALSQQPSGT
jgi:tRNA-Thr(GGU) m(6)t(6)A37 methyltransferase TsaA